LGFERRTPKAERTTGTSLDFARDCDYITEAEHSEMVSLNDEVGFERKKLLRVGRVPALAKSMILVFETV
jgi:hypothetical protein